MGALVKVNPSWVAQSFSGCDVKACASVTATIYNGTNLTPFVTTITYTSIQHISTDDKDNIWSAYRPSNKAQLIITGGRVRMRRRS